MVNVLLSRSINSQKGLVDNLKSIISPNMSVVIIALSYFEFMFKSKEDYYEYYSKNGQYYEKMIFSLSLLGIKEENIHWIYEQKEKKNDYIKLIEKSDIIYFPGGAPDKMYERINDMGLLDTLSIQNKIIIGSSAGAMIQFNKYHISKDNEYHKFEIKPGLGYLSDFGVEVHFRRRIQSKKGITAMRKATPRPIYVIEDSGYMIIKDKKIVYMHDAYMYTDGKKKVHKSKVL